MKTLREIMDLIVEVESGWQDPTNFRLPGSNGVVEIGERIDDSGSVVEVMMNFYDKDISAEDDGFVYGLRIKNDFVWEYKHGTTAPTRQIGTAKDHEKIKTIFTKTILNMIESLRENKMTNETQKSIYELCPGLEDAIDRALKRYSVDSEKRREKDNIDEASEESIKRIDDLYDN